MTAALDRLLADVPQSEALQRLLHGIANEIVHAENPYAVRDLVEKLRAHGKIVPAVHVHSEPPPKRPEPEEPAEPPEDEPEEDEPDDEEEGVAAHEVHTRTKPRRPQRHKR